MWFVAPPLSTYFVEILYCFVGHQCIKAPWYLADPSPILLPTSIQPCRTCVLGLFMCYRGWITAVPYMPSIQLWGISFTNQAYSTCVTHVYLKTIFFGFCAWNKLLFFLLNSVSFTLQLCPAVLSTWQSEVRGHISQSKQARVAS